MKRMIENLTGSYKSAAKVVDGTLILSLPDAAIPTVWRLDLGQVRASALEVREQKGDSYMLALKTPKGDVHDIAPFDTKAKAVAALMAVSHAMENAHGQIKPALFSANDDPEAARQYSNAHLPALYKKPVSAKKSTGRLIAGIAAIGLLIFMIGAIMNMSPKTYSIDGGNALTANTSTSSNTANSASATGVAISADDFLRNR